MIWRPQTWTPCIRFHFVKPIATFSKRLKTTENNWSVSIRNITKYIEISKNKIIYKNRENRLFANSYKRAKRFCMKPTAPSHITREWESMHAPWFGTQSLRLVRAWVRIPFAAIFADKPQADIRLWRSVFCFLG